MTPEVNVLLAASRPDHPHHRLALDWLDAAIDRCEEGQTFVVLPMVAAGFLRLATQPRVFAYPMPVVEALDFLHSVLEQAHVGMVPVGAEWPLLEGLCEAHQLAGNAIPEAWIAAAVQTSNEHLVTFEAGFRRYLGPTELTVLDG